MSGENLVDAQATLDQCTGEPVVSFHFDEEGARRFAQVTEENVGRLFAILLDEMVISAPMIREPIRGGSGQISGNFTEQSAKDLAVLLRSGALPATLHVLETHFVPAAALACASRMSQSLSFCPSRPASSCVNWKATRPERLPRVVAHSSASARSVSASIVSP